MLQRLGIVPILLFFKKLKTLGELFFLLYAEEAFHLVRMILKDRQERGYPFKGIWSEEVPKLDIIRALFLSQGRGDSPAPTGHVAYPKRR